MTSSECCPSPSLGGGLKPARAAVCQMGARLGWRSPASSSVNLLGPWNTRGIGEDAGPLRCTDLPAEECDDQPHATLPKLYARGLKVPPDLRRTPPKESRRIRFATPRLPVAPATVSVWLYRLAIRNHSPKDNGGRIAAVLEGWMRTRSFPTRQSQWRKQADTNRREA